MRLKQTNIASEIRFCRYIFLMGIVSQSEKIEMICCGAKRGEGKVNE